MAPISRNTWDNVVIITRDANGDVVWDGGVKNLVYDSATLTWIAQAAASTVGAGDASAANQVTEIAKLTSIDGKLPALVSSRVPVDGSGVTQPVSGTVTANAGTGTFAVSGTVTANAGTGTQAVSLASVPLPTGAATETTLAAASAKLPATLGQTTMANSLAVSIASNQSAIPVTTSVTDVTASGTITTQNLVPAGTATANSAVASGSLNGAGTAAVQVTGTYTGALSLQYTVDGSSWITVGGTPFLNVNTGAYTASIASAAVGIFQFEATGMPQFRITALAAVTGTATVTIRTSRASNLVALDNAIPTGANVIGALTANQSVNVNQLNAATINIGNGTAGTGTMRVAVASDQTAFSVNATAAGKTARNKARIDYTGTTVTTGAYVTLLAGTSATITEVEIFDSSGQTLVLATGAAASEVDQVYILPGGNGRIPLSIASSVRVAIKAVSASATAGEISVNFYG